MSTDEVPPDRNKTPLTHAVTETAHRYLADRGFKPLEREVWIASGWIADLAGVCTPSDTELVNLRLVKHAPKWPRASEPEKEAAYTVARSAWDDTRAAIPCPLTALVEVKTSVGDYRGDRKWTAERPTNLCYVAMPEGMVAREAWPQGWGVILTTANGLALKRVYPPPIVSITPEAQMWSVLRIANRMHNRVCYGRMSEAARKQRLEEAQYTTKERFRNVIKVVIDVTKGKTVEDALRYWGIRAKLPENVLADLAKLAPPLP